MAEVLGSRPRSFESCRRHAHRLVRHWKLDLPRPPSVAVSVSPCFLAWLQENADELEVLKRVDEITDELLRENFPDAYTPAPKKKLVSFWRILSCRTVDGQ